LGIEVCYQPRQMDFILDYLSRHTFDMVTLSVHFFGDRALHEPEQWTGFDIAGASRAYFDTVLEAVRFCRSLTEERGERVFDVLGHLDLVKRYTQRYFSDYDVASHRDAIDEILRTCLEARLTPEVNTSSWRQELPEPMPAAWVVDRFAALGGSAMTLGSDAHRSADIGAGLPEAADILRSAGISHMPVFRKRQIDLIPVD
jgi:histidinol-phosphatase (PHP family)